MIKFAIDKTVQFDNGVSQGEGIIEELGIISVFVRVTYSNSDEYPINDVIQIDKRYTTLVNFGHIKDTNSPKLTSEDYKALMDIALDSNDIEWAKEIHKEIVKEDTQ